MYELKDKIAKIISGAYEYVDFEKANEVPEFIRDLRKLYAELDTDIQSFEDYIEEQYATEIAERKEMIGQ